MASVFSDSERIQLLEFVKREKVKAFPLYRPGQALRAARG
jgi:hypothetical protein